MFMGIAFLLFYFKMSGSTGFWETSVILLCGDQEIVQDKGFPDL